MNEKKSSIGILLVNLGTPDYPETTSVRRFLAEFLADPRVVEIPRILWLPLLYGLILPFRSSKSAAAYKRIWTDRGSPLRALTQDLSTKIAHNYHGKNNIHIEMGMRYGSPSLATALSNLNRKKIDRLIVLPLYPQYSATTTASIFDLVVDQLKAQRFIPSLHFINEYYQQPDYIKAVANSIKNHWENTAQQHYLLMSFHGIPVRNIKLGDPYQEQCTTTAHAIAEELNLTTDQWEQTFQSRFGKAEWLSPYTDKRLQQLPGEGTKNIDVVCPGFPIDCLETLDEIAFENKELFLHTGGKTFNYIPALNDSEDHVALMTNIINQQLK